MFYSPKSSSSVNGELGSRAVAFSGYAWRSGTMVSALTNSSSAGVVSFSVPIEQMSIKSTGMRKDVLTSVICIPVI